MERVVGTVVRGLRAPIIHEGDNIQEIVINTVLQGSEKEGFSIDDGDIITITESIVARAQGNYASVDHIAHDVKQKFGDETIGVLFPILSRNRFAPCLRGIARAATKIVLMLSYPADEVGNPLITLDALDASGVNPWQDVLTEAEFTAHFGPTKHPFTGVDYIQYYRSIIEAEGAACEIIFANQAPTILDYTSFVLTCDVHSRNRTKQLLRQQGAQLVYGLDDLLTSSVNGSGFNETYGLLGSNLATEESVKLFPNNGQAVVNAIQDEIKKQTGKTVEVMINGDGAFKDPVGHIWELADPVVSPAFTNGLLGTPNEVKLKYLADNQFAHLEGKELEKAIKTSIQEKTNQAQDAQASLGTTPRQIVDLIGSLADLTSGSGDKGTPIVYIKGYFDHYAS